MKVLQYLERHKIQLFTIAAIGFALFYSDAILADTITSRIKETVDKVSTLLMLILVGAAAWSGFQLKGGNPQAVTNLIYCITAIVIVGSANALVNFFKV